jgi:protease I
MKTSVIITGKLVQDHEYIYPYFRLREDDISVDVAVDGGKEVQGQIGSRIIPTMDFETMVKRRFDLVVLPGGAKCMEYLRQDKRVINYIRAHYDKGGVIACICHAIQLLISAKIVAGKTVSGYYSLVDDIENAGAKYLDEPVVVDGSLVTTAHYKDMAPWMKTAIDLTLRV